RRCYVRNFLIRRRRPWWKRKFILVALLNIWNELSAETRPKRVLQGEDGGLGAVIGLNEMLGRLAPAAAAANSHHLRAIPLRQGWLRGTRFLSAEALATLVDSDDGTVERRKDVFAD